MKKLAFIFPGQGSQYPGMGRDLYHAYPRARAVFEEADRALGYSLSSLCFNGPAEELRLTYHTQPAILTVSAALLSLLAEAGIRPYVVAGHSLGEYSAYVAAGSLSFTDAVRLVRRRGELMESAVPAGEGTMGAILGLSREQVEEVCRQVRQERPDWEVAPATLNAPGQVVVAGHTPAVERALELAQEAGSRRTQLLEVSGPFHSVLLRSAAEELGRELARVGLRPPVCSVISNVTARPVADADEAARLLVEQVYRPVLWEDCVRTMLDMGVSAFVEVGPGRVLTGLIKRIDRRIPCYPVEDRESLENFLALQKGDGVR